MFWSHITTFHGIAVDWFLRVYWLLPRSIVASFKKHRRFFCWEPTILLLSTNDSFSEHRWILGPVNQLHFPKESFPYCNGLFFSSSTEIADSLAEVILNQQTPATRPSCYFCWQNGHAKDIGPKCFVGPCQDMRLRYWMTDINETKSLPCLVPYKKGNDSRIYSTCHFPSHLSIYWPLLFLFRDFVIPHTHHPGLHKGRSGWWDRWMKEVTSSETLPY